MIVNGLIPEEKKKHKELIAECLGREINFNKIAAAIIDAKAGRFSLRRGQDSQNDRPFLFAKIKLILYTNFMSSRGALATRQSPVKIHVCVTLPEIASSTHGWFAMTVETYDF